MIVAEQKQLQELKDLIGSAEKVLVVGCGTCVTVCFAGGEREAAIVASSLRMASKLDGNSVELIISDIKMPEMDGKRFYAEIREKKPELISRLIFITGDTLNSETRAFLREIKGHHLKKPFSFDEITDVIHAVTRKNSQRRLF